MSLCRVIQVIETDIQGRGAGVPGDIYRRVRQYYSLDGKLLAEFDPYPDGKTLVQDPGSRAWRGENC
jgi:hypothetical protein